MSTLVFMRRTPSEVEMFGGEVFVDIDGKNVGKVGLSDFEVTVPEGSHLIKMYKSHKYDTFIGFAQATLQMGANDKLLVKYSAPMVVSQPGNMVITDYDSQIVEQSARDREQIIKREVSQDNARKEEANRKSQDAVIWIIVIVIVTAILWAISWSMTMSSFKSLR
jgi:hypothetical protein